MKICLLLLWIAQSLAPPVEKGRFRKPGLVEITGHEPGIRLDIRYATTNNFLHRQFYSQPRAFLQRPAAAALLAVARQVQPEGYGLLIYDGYRPWSVTKMFWDSVSEENKKFVADPALAPNPAAKLFGDAPFAIKDKEVHTNAEAFSRIAAKMPANMVFPLLANILQLKGIFIEYGAQENFTHIVIGAQEVARKLTQAGVSNTLEVFQGDHGNHIVQRITERMLPWISKQIAPAP